MAPPWELRRRGLKDSLRHDQRVKEAIRKNLRELIAEEAIITSDGQKRVRIPLRYLDQYRFKYGQPQQGVGQGAGKQGDFLGQRAGDENDPGTGLPGDQPGELTYEVEIPLDELTLMMLEDLALPWLEEKPEKEVTTNTLRAVFAALEKKRVDLQGLILKSSLVLPGKECSEQADVRQVAEATIRTFKNSVPDTIAGIVFLSGGQTPQQATENLAEIIKQGPQPWPLSFSFSRALQEPVLEAWRGNSANIQAAQEAFLKRLRANKSALAGTYTKEPS